MGKLKPIALLLLNNSECDSLIKHGLACVFSTDPKNECRFYSRGKIN